MKQEVYSDGGLCNNNPTLQAFTEITNLLRHLNRHKTGAEEKRLTTVLSLGCSHRLKEEVDSETLNQLSLPHQTEDVLPLLTVRVLLPARH